MTIHALPTPDETDLEHQDRIGSTRAKFLACLAEGIGCFDSAVTLLAQLRGPELADTELVEGRDGRDLATILDDCIRHGRAAYAVMHAVIDKETP